MLVLFIIIKKRIKVINIKICNIFFFFEFIKNFKDILKMLVLLKVFFMNTFKASFQNLLYYFSQFN